MEKCIEKAEKYTYNGYIKKSKDVYLLGGIVIMSNPLLGLFTGKRPS